MKYKMLNFGVASLLALGFAFGISTQANAGFFDDLRSAWQKENTYAQEKQQKEKNIENNCKRAFDAVQEAFTHNIYGQKAEKQLFKATKYKVEDIYCKIFITNLYTNPLKVYGYLKIVDSDGVSKKEWISTLSSIDPEDTYAIKIYSSDLNMPVKKMTVVSDDNSVINSFGYLGVVPNEHAKKNIALF